MTKKFQGKKSGKPGSNKESHSGSDHWQTTFDAISDGVAIIDADDRFVRCNQAMVRLLGISEEKMIGRKCYQVIHGTDIPFRGCPVEKMRQTGRRESIEMAWNGRWLEVTVDPLFDERQTIIGAVHIVKDVSKHKKREQALQESENKYRTLIENVNDPIIATDNEFRIYSWNAAAEKIYGWSQKEATGRIFAEVIPVEYIGTTRSQVLQDFLANGTWQGEVVHTTREGRRLKIFTSVTSIHDSRGKRVGAIAVNRDISTLKQAEEALMESERKYRSLVENINDVIFTTEITGILTYISPQIETFLGYSPEEVMGRHFREFVHADDLDHTLERFRGVLSSDIQSTEYRLKSKTGEYRWARSSSQPILEQGNPVGIRGVITDIHQQRAIRQRLIESENKFRTLVDQAPEALFLHDMSGRIVDVNRVAVSRYGYTREELLEKSAADIDPDYVEREDRGRFWDQLDKQGPIQFEARHRKKDGTIFSVVVSLSGIQLKSRRHILALAGDISERKRAEEKLRISEEKYRELFDTMMHGVVYQDAEGHILSANRAALRIMGLTLDQMKGRTSMDPRWKSIHEDGSDFPGESHPSMVALDTGREVRNVVMGVASPQKEGVVWININAVPLFRPGENKPFQVYTTFEDITEKKRIEDALRESEARHAEAQRVAHIGHWELDPGLGTPVWSDEVYRIFGLKPDEQNPSFTEHDTIIHPEEWPLLNQAVNRLAGDGTPFDLVFRIQKKNGDIGWMHAIGTAKRDQDGKIVKLFGTAQDITDLERTREALRRSEERYRDLVEKADIAVMQDDREGRIVYCNERFAAMHGYTMQEMKTKREFEIIHPNDLAMVMEYHRARMKGEDAPSRYEFCALHRDGSALPLEVDVQTVRENGNTVGSRSYAWDITERKRIEAEVKRNLAEKEALLIEVHHRVKNNLNVITSLLSLQSDRLQSKEQAIRAFRESRDRIHAMAVVHEQLYQTGEFAGINMTKYTESLVRNLVQIYRPDETITPTLAIADVRITINQAIPLGLILNELITNALKHAFSGRKSGSISVTLRRLKNGMIELVFGDDGIGLPRSIDPDTAESMGLKLIDLLVRQLDGDLKVTRRNGTRFRMVFPGESQ